jgi:hypothetical protein
MKPNRTLLTLAVFVIGSFVTASLGRSPSRDALGKIDFQTLLDALPGMPATAAEAGKRTYGSDIRGQIQETELARFYMPFNQRRDAARAAIKPALDNRAQDQDAIARRAVSQADSSALISGMGGVEKMGQMSEEELKQAAAQAMGAAVQSRSGAPPGAGGGMQAMMQRLMNDPAYQARFEKMSKAEQEAELQKYMGNAQAPAALRGETAAERQAKQATAEVSGVLARQKELAALTQRLFDADAEFSRKHQAIPAAPGGYAQIAQDVQSRMAKVPLIQGEATMPDPAKMQPWERELATRNRDRASFELQQQSSLFTQRKARYKEIAAAYSAWLRQSLGGVNNQTAQLLDDATVQMALKFEEQLIDASDSLANYSSDATRRAAQYEQDYQIKMSEPLAR